MALVYGVNLQGNLGWGKDGNDFLHKHEGSSGWGGAGFLRQTRTSMSRTTFLPHCGRRHH